MTSSLWLVVLVVVDNFLAYKPWSVILIRWFQSTRLYKKFSINLNFAYSFLLQTFYRGDCQEIFMSSIMISNLKRARLRASSDLRMSTVLRHFQIRMTAIPKEAIRRRIFKISLVITNCDQVNLITSTSVNHRFDRINVACILSSYWQPSLSWARKFFWNFQVEGNPL